MYRKVGTKTEGREAECEEVTRQWAEKATDCKARIGDDNRWTVLEQEGKGNGESRALKSRGPHRKAWPRDMGEQCNEGKKGTGRHGKTVG